MYLSSTRIVDGYRPPTLAPAWRAPAAAKASSTTRTNQSSLQFQVRTAEGDTITLSIQAQQLSNVSRASYRAHGPGGGAAKVYESSQSNTLNASVTVQGSLSDEELQDVAKVLAALSQGKAVADASTVAAASYSYTNQFTVDRVRVSVQG